MMVQHLYDIGLVHIRNSLLIVSMIHQDNILTCCIFQDLGGLHLEIIQEILTFLVQLAGNDCYSIEPQGSPQICIGYCSAYSVAVWILVSNHIGYPLFWSHSLI